MVSAGLRQDDDADSKSRRAKAGKDRGADDAENAKKLVQDLLDAFNGFGVSHSFCFVVLVTAPPPCSILSVVHSGGEALFEWVSFS